MKGLFFEVPWNESKTYEACIVKDAEYLYLGAAVVGRRFGLSVYFATALDQPIDTIAEAADCK